MNNRAISFLEIKKVDDEARTIEGIASTPTADRLGDIVEPKGAEFKLPIPFLWQHDSAKPVGHVTEAKVTDKGILIKAQIVKIDEPGIVRDRVDEAWQSIKSGLVKGLSIGFKGLDVEPIDKKDPFGFGGRRFLKWLWLELSAVTIAANGDCTITQLKAIDSGILAASGKEETRTVRLIPPGVSGNATRKPERADDMKTNSEMIESLEATRAAKAAAIEKLMERSQESNETMDANETKEFDALKGDIDRIDDDLKRRRDVEKMQAKSAKPVDGVKDDKSGTDNRDPAAKPAYGANSVKGLDKPAPGIRMARVMKCLGRGGNPWAAAQVAETLYGKTDPVIVNVLKANVGAGATLSGNWAENLVGDESSVFADFAEYLRAQTILGKFGNNGIPGLRNVPFRVALVSQTTGFSGYWVGEGKAKPLTKGAYARTTLEPLKVAAICAVTEELLMDSSPSAEANIRDELVAALRERLDQDFINPDMAGSAGVSPASILNGITPLASSGSDADGVRADVRRILGAFIAAHNPPTTGVWIMSQLNALAVGLMRNPLGQTEFPGITVNGGTLEGFPVITSENVSPNTGGDYVALVNASDIYLGDEGGFKVDLSREASLEMSDAPAHNSTTPTAAQLVSMFQTNSVAFRAERRISWKRRRDSGVQWMTNVQWGAGTT